MRNPRSNKTRIAHMTIRLTVKRSEKRSGSRSKGFATVKENKVKTILTEKNSSPI